MPKRPYPKEIELCDPTKSIIFVTLPPDNFMISSEAFSFFEFITLFAPAFLATSSFSSSMSTTIVFTLYAACAIFNANNPIPPALIITIFSPSLISAFFKAL